MRRTFGLSAIAGADFSPPIRISHFSASARISRSVPGYHDPAIALSSVIFVSYLIHLS
jgi:hypothetical protein